MLLILEVAGGVVLGVVVLIVLYGLITVYGSQIAGGLIQLIVWPIVFLIAYGLFGFACWGAQTVWHYVVPRYVDSESAHLFIDPVIGFTVIVGPILLFIDSLNNFAWIRWVFRRFRPRPDSTPITLPVSAPPPTPELAPWEIEQKERSERRAQLRKLYADRFTPSDSQ